mgnify:CR=1 FL=1
MNAPTGHIVSRLRSLAKADHDDLSVAEEAAEYIEALERYGKELEAWKDEGESLAAKASETFLFWLGGWWADRTWRRK